MKQELRRRGVLVLALCGCAFVQGKQTLTRADWQTARSRKAWPEMTGNLTVDSAAFEQAVRVAKYRIVYVERRSGVRCKRKEVHLKKASTRDFEGDRGFVVSRKIHEWVHLNRILEIGCSRFNAEYVGNRALTVREEAQAFAAQAYYLAYTGTLDVEEGETWIPREVEDMDEKYQTWVLGGFKRHLQDILFQALRDGVRDRE